MFNNNRNDKKPKVPQDYEQIRYEIFEAAMIDNDFLVNDLHGDIIFKSAIIKYLKSMDYNELASLWTKAQNIKIIRERNIGIFKWKNNENIDKEKGDDVI